MNIIGIDVSKNSFDVAWQSESGYQSQVYEYTDVGINALLAEIGEAAHYVMEATGVYHARLALKLYEAGCAVSVVNPLVIKRYSQQQLRRVKSDKADARLICEYGQSATLTRWEPSAEVIVDLSQAHGWLDDLIVERTRVVNRREALVHQARVNPFVLRQMDKQLAQLAQQIEACEQHLEAVVKKHFAPLYSRLLSIRSIGPKTALELIIITHGFTRFDQVKSLSAYVGLSPTTYRSGTSVRGAGHIAKLGNGRIRQLLYLCSWTAKRCNRACAQLHARLKAAGKPPKVINIAIAHKLLRQAFAVATKGEMYSEKAL